MSQFVQVDDSLSSYTLPLSLVLGLFVFSSIGPYWTFGSFLAFPVVLQIFRKNFVYEKVTPTDSAASATESANVAQNPPAVPRRGVRRHYVQGMTKFYYNLTRFSVIVSVIISEFLCLERELAHWRRLTLALTLGCIWIVKKRALSSSPINHQAGGNPGDIPGPGGSSRDYCSVCGVLVPGRDHHCSWLDCCIGQRNWAVFISALIASSFHASTLVYSCFTSVCEGQLSGYYFWTTSDSGYTLQCPLIYVEYSSTFVWILFLYGLVILALLIAILYHQFIRSRRKFQHSNQL